MADDLETPLQAPRPTPPDGGTEDDGRPDGGTQDAAAPADGGAEDDAARPEAGGLAPPRRRSVGALRTTRRVLWIAVAVAVPVAMLVAVLATRQPATTRAADSPLLNKAAPDVEATSVDGQKVRLSDLRGRWVLLNFFATWCVPCVNEHPDLVRFSQAHDAAGDARVLGVVYSDSTDAVKDFRAQHGGSWPLLVDGKGKIALDYGVSGVPESFLISPDGVVAAKILGGVRQTDLERLLDEAKARR